MTTKVYNRKTKRTKSAARMGRTQKRPVKQAPKPAETKPETHPGLVPVLGAYHETFRKVLGFDGEYTFCNGDPFAGATIGEMFAWYMGGSNCSDLDIWAPLRDQAQAARELIDCFREYHPDLPSDYQLNGEWADRVQDIARRIEVLAWLHHRTVTEIRMNAVNARKAELAGGAS